MSMEMQVPAAIVVMMSSGLCGAADAPATPDVLDRIAPQTHLAIVIPNLKLASDELSQCLEGMGKADVLGLARPIDLLKSQLNISVGVDDDGSAAMIYSQGPGESLTGLMLVPVNDASQFLAANFRAGQEPGSYLQVDGKVVFAKALGTHVAISSNSRAVRAYEPGAGLGALVKEHLGERAQSIWSRGEIVVYADQSQLKSWREGGEKRLAQELAALNNAGGGAVGLDHEAGAALLDHARCAVTAVDFDPLALIVHSYLSFEPQSEAARLTAGGPNRGRGMTRLPDKPFYVAASVDVAGLGGPEALGALLRTLGRDELPAWMRDAQGLQFAAYPSPAGMQGGVLNDAVLVLETSKPEDAKFAFRQFVTTLPEPVAGVKHVGKWEENRTLKTGATADAYEVLTQITGDPPEAMMLAMYESLLFGNAGWRGFAKTTNDALIVTFSQRPAVLDAALGAAATDSKSSLATNAVIRTMRSWMPEGADVEAYLGMGSLAGLIGQLSQSLPMPKMIRIPADAAKLDPLGFALEVGDGAMQMTLVIPASVLAASVDQVLEPQRDGQTPEPAPNGQGQRPTETPRSKGSPGASEKPETSP